MNATDEDANNILCLVCLLLALAFSLCFADIAASVIR